MLRNLTANLQTPPWRDTLGHQTQAIVCLRLVSGQRDDYLHTQSKRIIEIKVAPEGRRLSITGDILHILTAVPGGMVF